MNGQGLGYGYFIFNTGDLAAIRSFPGLWEDDKLRAAVYIGGFENFLHGNIHGREFFQFITEAISVESDPLLVRMLLSQLEQWSFSFPWYGSSGDLVILVEELLWEKMTTAAADQAEMYFESWLRLARSPESTLRMRQLYLGEYQVGALVVSDMMKTRLVLEALLRDPGNNDLVDMEKERMNNPDRLRRLAFILPSVSADKLDRERFFGSIRKPENRRPEPWVLDALHFLHHPLHDGQGFDFLRESLAMLPEIQSTGDIFFPLNWLQATLQNYSDPLVARWVEEFLEQTPELNDNLRLKVLQAADLIFRSAELARDH